MKVILLILTLTLMSCEVITLKKEPLKVGDCFEIPTVKGTFFKVRSVLKRSYLAGRYSGKKFYPKYPAMQITSVPFDQPIWSTDCIRSEGWSKKWDEAVINEYNDRKSQYSKDAVIPKNKE